MFLQAMELKHGTQGDGSVGHRGTVLLCSQVNTTVPDCHVVGYIGYGYLEGTLRSYQKPSSPYGFIDVLNLRFTAEWFSFIIDIQWI